MSYSSGLIRLELAILVICIEILFSKTTYPIRPSLIQSYLLWALTLPDTIQKLLLRNFVFFCDDLVEYSLSRNVESCWSHKSCSKLLMQFSNRKFSPDRNSDFCKTRVRSRTSKISTDTTWLFRNTTRSSWKERKTCFQRFVFCVAQMKHSWFPPGSPEFESQLCRDFFS